MRSTFLKVVLLANLGENNCLKWSGFSLSLFLIYIFQSSGNVFDRLFLSVCPPCVYNAHIRSCKPNVLHYVVALLHACSTWCICVSFICLSCKLSKLSCLVSFRLRPSLIWLLNLLGWAFGFKSISTTELGRHVKSWLVSVPSQAKIKFLSNSRENI